MNAFKKAGTICAMVAVLFLWSTREANAGITYINRTGETVWVAVITTFGSHIYADGWFKLDHEQSRQIGSGKFSQEDTYWVVVLRDRDRSAMQFYGNKSYGTKDRPVYCSPSFAYVERNAYAGGQIGTESYIVNQMRNDDWTPFLRRFGGTRHVALKVDPYRTYSQAFLIFLPNGDHNLALRGGQ